MAIYGGSRRNGFGTYEVLVDPTGPGNGDILLPDAVSVPWSSDGGGVWVHVGVHRTGTIREDGSADHVYWIPEVER